MASRGSFEVSQGLEVLRPKSGKAYPIPCSEWNLLKSKIEKATDEPWLFHSLGSALLGMALSAAFPLLTSAFSLPEQQRSFEQTIAVFVVTSVLGLAFLYLSHRQRQVARERNQDVLAQMQIIEERYESAS